MSQSNLFSGYETPLPAWLPDETLYSLSSRTHVLSGSPTPSRVSRQLFGGNRRGWQHDFPGFLAHLHSVTSGVWGSAEKIARSKTLLAFYRVFLSDADEAAFVRHMSDGDVAHLKFRMGLLTSRFRANHPLKACPACICSDRDEHGWSYWHRRHQFPGVWVCEKHGQVLLESTLKSTGVERFGWVLPDESTLRAPGGLDAKGEVDGIDVLKHFSNLIVGLVEGASYQRVDRMSAHDTYKRRLASTGFVRNGRFLWDPLVRAFDVHFRRVRLLPEFNHLDDSESALRSYLGRLLRPPRSCAHPLWHLLLVDWLFGGTKEFFEASSAGLVSSQVPESPQERAYAAVATDQRRVALISRIRDYGESVRAASLAVGVDTSTGMSWAAAAGISVKRRSKALKPDVRVAIEQSLRGGADKTELASQFGISVQTVTRTLLTTPGLHHQWTEARFSNQRSRHRRLWLVLCRRYPGAGVKLIRTHAYATYAWLYRNDRGWLVGHRPDPVKRTNVGLPAAVWSNRDDALCAQVSDAANRVIAQKDCTRLFLWQLYQEVDGLRPMLRRLDRLPRTRKAIEVALGWRRTRADQPDLFP